MDCAAESETPEVATNSSRSTQLAFTLRQPVTLHPKEFLNSRYRVLSTLWEGAHAVVFEVIDDDHRTFAAKAQQVHEDIPELEREFEFCRYAMMSFPDSFYPIGLPTPYAYGNFHGTEYLIMDCFGKNLLEIANNCDQGTLLAQDVLMIGIQAVRRLQLLHKKKILHCDIEPENFAMGLGPSAEKTVHLFDFGSAVFVEDWDTYNYENDVGFSGDEYFAPVEALLHKPPTRRGDMESLCYTLVWLAHGGLPWSTVHHETGRKLSHAEMAHQRISCTTGNLAGPFPVLEEFVKTSLQMKRRDEPDYERLITILENGLAAEGAINDGLFEWLVPKTQVTSAVGTIETGQQSENRDSSETIDISNGSKSHHDAGNVMSKTAHEDTCDI